MWFVEDEEEGVGDRQLRSDEGVDLPRKVEDRKVEEGPVAGEGVDTPRALAKAARRCGGNGDLGGPHAGGVLGAAERPSEPAAVDLDSRSMTAPED